MSKTKYYITLYSVVIKKIVDTMNVIKYIIFIENGINWNAIHFT